MGKGDKKSKRGKIFRGTFGKRRPRKAKSFVPVSEVKDEKKKSEKKIDLVKPEEVKTEKKTAVPGKIEEVKTEKIKDEKKIDIVKPEEVKTEKKILQNSQRNSISVS